MSTSRGLATGLLIVGAICSRTLAVTYYVSADNGSDQAAGTLAAPYLTIQKAAAKMAAGDSCLIRAGIYRETVIPAANGASGRPVVFTAYQNENVFISGADPVTGWTQDAGAVWKAPLSWDLGQGRNQLCVAGEAMVEAREPNIDAERRTAADGNVTRNSPTTYVPASMINPAFIGTASEKGAGVLKMWIGTVSGNAKLTPFFDSCRTKNAAQDFLAGAIVHHSGNYWSSETGLMAPGWGVEPAGSSMDGWMYVKVNAPNWEFNGGNTYFTGLRVFLNSPREWVLDNGIMYFWPPGNADPNKILTEAKRRQLVMDLSGRDYVVVNGINFLAGSINMNRANNCTIDDCHFRYLTHWTISPNFTTDRWAGETAIAIRGKNNKVVNSSIEYSAASGIFVIGDGNVVDNCLIHDCDYLGTYEVGVATGDTMLGHNTISRCTMYNFGRSAITLAAGVQGSIKTGQTWTRNNIYNCMSLVEDGGSIYYAGSAGSGSEVSYNWFHDMIRPWNAHHIYYDYGGGQTYIHHNVFWQTYDWMAENNSMAHYPYCQINYNNTSLQSPRSDVYKPFDDDERGVNALWVQGDYTGWGIRDYANQDFTLLSTSKAIDQGRPRVDTMYQQLKTKFPDFLPMLLDTPIVIADSSITGKAPDLGAYEYGKPRWVPGHTWGAVSWVYPPGGSAVSRIERVGPRTAAMPGFRRVGANLVIRASLTSGCTASLLDALGRRVASVNLKPGVTKSIAIPSSLVYVLRIETERGTFVRRLVSGGTR